MPASLTYPGVYVEELESSVRTITGVPTSTAAFVGPAPRGPVGGTTHITSWTDYERVYGGLAAGSLMSFAVYHFFQNGGAEAEILRIAAADAATAGIDLGGGVTLAALGPGAWAEKLQARVDKDAFGGTWTLTVYDAGTKAREVFPAIQSGADAKRTLDVALRGSRLVKSTGDNKAEPPASDAVKKAGDDPFADGEKDKQYKEATGAGDGSAIAASDYTGDGGLDQLLKTDIFNLLCVYPAGDSPADLPGGVVAAANKLCVDRRAVLVLDPPAAWTDVGTAHDGFVGSPPVGGDEARNTALFFPLVTLPDPIDNGKPKDYPPSGAVAGLIARTDAQRGVWKAPAGTDAALNGALGPSLPMTDLENGRLNPLGINCIRKFPLYGTVNWGARTGRGADAFADPWKYLPVRRTALYIEESLYRGTKWVVFEPNDEPLWASVRLNVGAFMNGLFRQGAFQGRTPREAYLVKCDKETNPQDKIDLGILTILVGFAPLKPAEFVVIQIEQLNPQLAA
jgi:uncharacterized protein